MWRKPYGVLLIAAAVPLLYSFFNKEALDIHLHDTYIVINNSHLCWVMVLLLLFFAFLYRALRDVLPFKLLTWLHIAGTLIGLSFMLLPVTYQGFASAPRSYYDDSAWESYQQFGRLNRAVAWMVVFCFFAQIVFLLHILLGLLRLFSRRR